MILKDSKRWRLNLCRGISRLLIIVLLLTTASTGLAEDIASHGQLNLNTATVEQLQQLPFIGKTRARAIVDFRQQQGQFSSLEELLSSKTVGPETYKAIKPYLKLNGSSNLATEPDQTFLKVRIKVMTRPGEIRILPDREYYDELLYAIRQAEYDIFMSMFIFRVTDSPTNRPAEILRELIAAKKRGVRVRVLLERSDYNESLTRENKQVAARLKKKNIEVTLDSPQTTTHTKAVVVDERYVFVGSHNLTHSALALNHEFSLLVDNRDLAKEVLSYLKKLH